MPPGSAPGTSRGLFRDPLGAVFLWKCHFARQWLQPRLLFTPQPRAPTLPGTGVPLPMCCLLLGREQEQKLCRKFGFFLASISSYGHLQRTRGSICLLAHSYNDACSRSQVVSRVCRGSCLKQRSRQAQHPFPQGFPVNHLQAASQLSALPAPRLQTCQDVHPVPAKSSKKGRLPPRVPSPANWASERWGISSGRG